MTDAIQGLVSAAKNAKFSAISSNLSDEGELSQNITKQGSGPAVVAHHKAGLIIV
jgi:hypothetical protein